MKLVADESVDHPIVDRLRADGHEVHCIADSTPGAPDDAVLAYANARDSVLLTSDRDFGELVYRLGRIHAGVLLLRLAGMSMSAKIATVSDAVASYGHELRHAFSVLSKGQLRVRRGTAID